MPRPAKLAHINQPQYVLRGMISVNGPTDQTRANPV